MMNITYINIEIRNPSIRKRFRDTKLQTRGCNSEMMFGWLTSLWLASGREFHVGWLATAVHSSKSIFLPPQRSCCARFVVLVSPKLKLIAIIIYYLMILMIISTWERRSLASFSWKQLVKWLNFGRFTSFFNPILPAHQGSTRGVLHLGCLTRGMGNQSKLHDIYITFIVVHLCSFYIYPILSMSMWIPSQKVTCLRSWSIEEAFKQ